MLHLERPTLTSTYGPLTALPGPRFKNRAGQFLVEPPPAPPPTFHGLSPVKSFLASSSHPFNPQPGADSESIDQYDTRHEHVNYRIIRGVKYDSYPRNGVPYYMLFDQVSTETDLHTHQLFQKLSKDGSPTFIYISPSSPVRNALEIGCGEGHWVEYAAEVWRAHETKVTGIDVPLSNREKQKKSPGSIAENANLLYCNFVTEKLPFSDNSFDYVRLNDAMAVIPQDCWDFVLSEIHRVMTPGGRLELIHDQLCFSSVGRDASVSSAQRMTTPPRSKTRPHDDDREAEMRNCNNLERLYLEMLAQRYGVHPQPRAILLDAIQRQFGNCGLVKTSNYHVCLPSKEFVARNCAGALKGAVPKKRELGLGITIDWGTEKSTKTPVAKPPRYHHGRSFSLTNLPLISNKKPAKATDAIQSSPTSERYQPPGVVVFPTSSDGSRRPMTFISMSPTELEMHSNKHVHAVISAQKALEAHSDELRVNGKPSISHEALNDALWQYSLFRRKRFNWPELDPFVYETDEEGQTYHLTLDNQATDGLTPIRLVEIFEVFRV